MELAKAEEMVRAFEVLSLKSQTGLIINFI